MRFKFDILDTGFSAEARRHIARWCIGLGISFGSNHTVNNRPVNFFIEVDILFWRLGLEWKRK